MHISHIFVTEIEHNNTYSGIPLRMRFYIPNLKKATYRCTSPNEVLYTVHPLFIPTKQGCEKSLVPFLQTVSHPSRPYIKPSVFHLCRISGMQYYEYGGRERHVGLTSSHTLMHRQHISAHLSEIQSCHTRRRSAIIQISSPHPSNRRKKRMFTHLRNKKRPGRNSVIAGRNKQSAVTVLKRRCLSHRSENNMGHLQIFSILWFFRPSFPFYPEK